MSFGDSVLKIQTDQKVHAQRENRPHSKPLVKTSRFTERKRDPFESMEDIDHVVGIGSKYCVVTHCVTQPNTSALVLVGQSESLKKWGAAAAHYIVKSSCWS